MTPNTIKSRAINFIEAKIANQIANPGKVTDFPADVISKHQSGELKFNNGRVYLNARVSLAPGNSELNILSTDTKKKVGITNLEDGKTLPKNSIFGATALRVSYGQGAITAGTPADVETVTFTNCAKSFAAGAYSQFVPALLLNSEIIVKVNTREVYRGPLSDFFRENNIADQINDKGNWVHLDSPVLITDQDTVSFLVKPPEKGAAIGGTIAEYLSVSLGGTFLDVSK